MNKKIIFILPLVFLILSIFNIPLVFPSFLLKNHYFVPYLNYVDARYYYDLLRKYPKYSIVYGFENLMINKKVINSIYDLESTIKNFKYDNSIGFFEFLKYILDDLNWYEKPIIILPFYPFAEEMQYLVNLEKERGIPIKVIIEKSNNIELIGNINTRHYLNEKKVVINIFFSSEIDNFYTISLSKIEKEKKINLVSKKTEEIVKNSNIFEYSYFYKESEKMAKFEITLTGNTQKNYEFYLNLNENLDKNILYISEDSSTGFFEKLFNMEKVDLKNIKSINLKNYSLIIFDGIPIKKIDEEISRKLVEGYNSDDFGIFFISEAKEFGKSEDNPLIESILPIELNPKSLKQDPKVAILLLLDVSSSMMGQKLSIAKISAAQLIKNLKPDDLVSIYLFWDQYEKLFDFTAVNEVKGFFSFDKIEATGGTDLAPCLLAGLKDLIKIPSINKHTVIISDFQTKPALWDNILSYAIDNDITISVIQIGQDINPILAEKIAKTTGGNIYSANTFDAIPTILFEDRKRISRPPFIKQNYTIFDSFNDIVASVKGMNITTSKEKSMVVFKNQYEDPLFAFVKNGSKSCGIFLSDSKGVYTENFFSSNYVKNIFRKYFESQISNPIVKYTLNENAAGFSILINSTKLFSPSISIYKDGEKIGEAKLSKYPNGFFSFSISTINKGNYDLVIKDLGIRVLKIPVYFNGIASFDGYSSVLFYNLIKNQLFRNYYNINIWLVLFFLSSILTTYILRIFNKN